MSGSGSRVLSVMSGYSETPSTSGAGGPRGRLERDNLGQHRRTAGRRSAPDAPHRSVGTAHERAYRGSGEEQQPGEKREATEDEYPR